MAGPSRRAAQNGSKPALHIEELETRLLLSADSLGLLAADTFTSAQVANEFLLDDSLELVNRSQAPAENEDLRLELVFVDSDTPDYQQLVSDLLDERNEGRRIDVIVLDNERDGVAQITETLQAYNAVDAIHLISHGSDGRIDLGSTQLDGNNLGEYAGQLQAWGTYLDAEADILIYGCNLAASADGEALIDQIAALTGTDIAASNDLTGNVALGGDYELEYHTGSLETEVAFSTQAQQDWDATLALETIRDEFNALLYSNNDGTQSWTGDWLEIAEPTGPGSTNGPVQVSPNVANTPTPNSLRIGGTQPSNPDPGFGALREADLSAATSATLTFDYQRGTYGSPVVTAGTMTLDISDDGGTTWTTLKTYNFDGTDISQTSESIDISAYTAANTQVRFLTHGPVDDIVFFIDDIQIEYNTAPANSAPVDLRATSTTQGGVGINADGGNDTYYVADNGGALLGGLTQITIEATFSVATAATDNTVLLSYASGSNDEELALFIKPDGRIWLHTHSNGSVRYQ